MKPFGIDVSRYQGVINWDVVAAHIPKVEFVGIRAAISWGYVDPFFKSNYAEAKRVGIPRTAYHVIYPKEDPIRQMNHFISVMDGDWGDLNPVIDVELSHNATPREYRDNLLTALNYLHSKTGRRAIIYSRATFIDWNVTGTSLNSNAVAPAWYNDYDWWLAQYLSSGVEHQGPPTLPIGVTRDRVIIHQTSEKGIPIGMPQAGALDYNRWQPEARLTVEEYVAQFTSPPPPEENPCQELIDQNEALIADNTKLTAENKGLASDKNKLLVKNEALTVEKNLMRNDLMSIRETTEKWE
jgi:GH25 family lysozyme M1 (1,4-beta-N-acetylmuramidase)